MKQNTLHGATPIEHKRSSRVTLWLQALTRQTDFRQLGNVFLLLFRKILSADVSLSERRNKSTLFRRRFYYIQALINSAWDLQYLSSQGRLFQGHVQELPQLQDLSQREYYAHHRVLKG